MPTRHEPPLPNATGIHFGPGCLVRRTRPRHRRTYSLLALHIGSWVDTRHLLPCREIRSVAWSGTVYRRVHEIHVEYCPTWMALPWRCCKRAVRCTVHGAHRVVGTYSYPQKRPHGSLFGWHPSYAGRAYFFADIRSIRLAKRRQGMFLVSDDDRCRLADACVRVK